MTPRNTSQTTNAPIGSEVSIIPRSAERCFLQSNSVALQATSNYFFQPPYTALCYLDPVNQDLNMAESPDLNCKQSSKTINSLTEFDTELFQTDIRELFRELPELADDSTPVQDDIHNFLPEPVTASPVRHETRARGRHQNSLERTNENRPKHKLLLRRITRRQH